MRGHVVILPKTCTSLSHLFSFPLMCCPISHSLQAAGNPVLPLPLEAQTCGIQEDLGMGHWVVSRGRNSGSRFPSRCPEWWNRLIWTQALYSGGASWVIWKDESYRLQRALHREPRSKTPPCLERQWKTAMLLMISTESPPKSYILRLGTIICKRTWNIFTLV